jgi:hypothetical protein
VDFNGSIDRRYRLHAGGVAIGEIDYFVLFPDLGFSIQLQPSMAMLLFVDRSHLCTKTEPHN